MRLNEMKHILAVDDIQLTKSLGQNFLHDANQVRRIVEAAQLTKQDKVLEVGPGLGPLTKLLVEQAGEVLAIEKDGRLVKVLRERFPAGQASQPEQTAQSGTDGTPGLHLVHDDALDYFKRAQGDWSEWKLVSNLPYSVASTILVELALAQRGPRLMSATLQIEVANRLMARPGDDDYGVFTLLLLLGYELHNWFKIPASCFFPEPDVDSACVCLVRREPPLLPTEHRRTFIRVVKRSFSQRRKMMMKLLRADWSRDGLERAFKTMEISLQARAESVSLEQFAGLTQLLHGQG
jgi:16S rRNA (adenine1518-N6/adenine1519-N6)-dimethyltransferase